MQTDLDIYKREDLLEIYKDPMNMGTISQPDVSVDDSNPFCGDKITLMLKINNDVIEDIKFFGDACAVSVISSALVTEQLIGKSIDDAKKFSKDNLLKILNINLTTSRVKCATLVLSALRKAINKYEQESKQTENK